jgi:hypothetical protein
MKLNDESVNKAVITTRYVLDANSLITYVVYDEDGDWQFFSDEDVTESDACIVSVKQILALDDSLNELDLKPGQATERSDADAPWQTIKRKSSRDNSFSKEEDDN